jgi:uncharacterized protein YndB with AHSA1/START domain
MPEPQTVAEPLVLTRVYRAPIERVFRAWIEKADLERWYTPEGVVAVEHLDVRPGGSYRVKFGPEGQDPYFETGTYEQIDPPRLLQFRARLERAGALIADTHCTVRFRDLGGSTEVTMTETGFPESAREDRRGGWGRTLDHLFPVVEAGS